MESMGFQGDRPLSRPKAAPERLCRVLGLQAFFVVASLLSRPTAAAELGPRRPNVLLILCDDLRWNALGCARHPTLKTPHIDRLALEGVRLANMACTPSLCLPSRASILTGLYARAHNVTDNFTELPNRHPHWPQRLQQEGYATASIGKWHMGENNDAPRPGSDFFATDKGQGKYVDAEWNLNGRSQTTVPGYHTTIVTDMALRWRQEDHLG